VTSSTLLRHIPDRKYSGSLFFQYTFGRQPGYTDFTTPLPRNYSRRTTVDWYDDYNIDVELIDSQHQELVKMITRLQDALSAGSINYESATVLKFLVEYTQKHFKDEEKVMATIDFAELENHRKLHGRLIEEIRNILLDLKKGKPIHAYELIDFLTSWLMNHIRHEDKKIGRAIEKFKTENNGWNGASPDLKAKFRQNTSLLKR
jgi:hemerythrin-like metal-binding protein